jgi:hypothetical protein
MIIVATNLYQSKTTMRDLIDTSVQKLSDKEALITQEVHITTTTLVIAAMIAIIMLTTVDMTTLTTMMEELETVVVTQMEMTTTMTMTVTISKIDNKKSHSLEWLFCIISNNLIDLSFL